MKRYITIAITLLLGWSLTTAAQGIEFDPGSWAEIKAKAESENKLIFLDFYTEWCAPCKKMAKKVFPLPEAGLFFNQRFINVKVDAEKGEGIALAKLYRPSGYPTLVFTNAKGEQLYRATGAQNVKELIKHAKIALNPQEDYELLKEQYQNNAISNEDLYRYLLIVKAKGNDTEVNAIFDKYFEQIGEASKPAFEMMEAYVNSSKTRSFNFLLAHRLDFYRFVGKERVEAYIKKILFDELAARFFYYGKQEPLEQYQAAKAVLKSKVNVTEKEELELDKSYYQQIKDEDNFMKTAATLVAKYSYNNDQELSMILGAADLIKKKEHLQLMKKWAERAVEIENNSLNYLSLAMLYDQLEDKDNALKYVELAIGASKRDDDGKAVILEQFKQRILQHYVTATSTQAEGIVFKQGSWDDIKAMAKAQNKLIFVDFYTDWCAPCKYMSQHIFTQKEAGDFYNKNFIAYKVNAEKDEGPALARAYNVSGYPTLLFVDYNGNVALRLVGSTDLKGLLEQGKTALMPRGDFNLLKEKFAKNTLDEKALYAYFILLKNKGDNKESERVFERYFDVVAKINQETYNLITKHVTSSKSKAFLYLQAHRRDFSDLIGQEKVKSYSNEIYTEEFQSNVWSAVYKTSEEYENAKDILKTNVDLSEQEELAFDTDYYLRMEEEDNFMKPANKLVEKYYYNNDFQISNLLGGASRLVKKRENILILKNWAERALDLKDNFINNATLAMIYNKLNNKPMALKYIDIAIEQCKRDKNGYQDRAEMMKKEIAASH